MGFALVRYNADGELDMSLAVATASSPHQSARAMPLGQSVVVQSDGKILVAGIGPGGSANMDFALVRYNSEGSLDTSW